MHSAGVGGMVRRITTTCIISYSELLSYLLRMLCVVLIPHGVVLSRSAMRCHLSFTSLAPSP
jgi:hypothetical protein